MIKLELIIQDKLLVSIIGKTLDSVPNVNHNNCDITVRINHFIDKSLERFVIYVFQTCGI